MAVGEYVSVSSQRDAERADLAQERRELAADPVSELNELTRIYERRGLDAPLAAEVARQLTHHDALGAHVRDELGITDVALARPLQAAWLVGGRVHRRGPAPPAGGTGQPVVATDRRGRRRRPRRPGRARVRSAPASVAPQSGAAAARITALGALAMAVTAVIGAAVGSAVRLTSPRHHELDQFDVDMTSLMMSY